jgi:Xaa-Pro aminopeptidase
MSHAPTVTLSHRHAAIRQALAARGLDALVVTSLPNILYLSNFAGSSAIVVVTADRFQFITDFRYIAAVSDVGRSEWACPGLELARVDSSYDETLADVVEAIGPRRIAFEAAHLTVSRLQWLESRLRREGSDLPSLVPTEGLVEHARLRKDPYEIATLREAARRLSAVAIGVFGDVGAGKTEREIALAIDWRIRQGGFDRSAFDTIVASGANAALPHARPTGRILSEGDLVVLDFGGVYDSYCVDLTRTVSVGRAAARAREVHGAVLEAHDRAIQAVAPGRTRFEIDAVARDTLGTHGLAEAFGHGTGHGLGVEVHEDPRIGRRRSDSEGAAADDLLAAGMVFTIEPGAYLPGWGGVRIEDDVLVTEDGVELLTNVPTDLIEL